MLKQYSRFLKSFLWSSNSLIFLAIVERFFSSSNSRLISKLFEFLKCLSRFLMKSFSIVCWDSWWWFGFGIKLVPSIFNRSIQSGTIIDLLQKRISKFDMPFNKKSQTHRIPFPSTPLRKATFTTRIIKNTQRENLLIPSFVWLFCPQSALCCLHENCGLFNINAN
jgi:hypothetical protein